jgi:hypothetical protein
MTNQLRVTVETGPKKKKVVAVAVDWPGLERGAKTEEAVMARLQSYLPRYAQVANLAGLEEAFATSTMLEIIEHYPGSGSTDFWGISFAFSSIDHQPLSTEELERQLTLMQACWTFFDGVRARVSADMQKGPRGGGRDRDEIVHHTFWVEMTDWAPKVGLPNLYTEDLTDAVVSAHRDAYCKAIRAYHAAGKMARTWPLRYLIRHTAYHTMDHAWEMEDKDLTKSS